MPKLRYRDSLPKAFMDRVVRRPDGSKRPAKMVEWFLIYLEHGDGPRAVREAGYQTRWPSTLANRFTHEFRMLAIEAFLVKNSMSQMLAQQVQEDVLTMSCEQPLLDDEGKVQMWTTPAGEREPVMQVDPKLMALKVKAAQFTLSQGPLPPGLALRGLQVGLEENHRETDFRRVLDAMVQEYGGGTDGAVRLLSVPGVGNHKEYREYLVDRYQVPRLVNPSPEPLAELEAGGHAN